MTLMEKKFTSDFRKEKRQKIGHRFLQSKGDLRSAFHFLPTQNQPQLHSTSTWLDIHLSRIRNSLLLQSQPSPKSQLLQNQNRPLLELCHHYWTCWSVQQEHIWCQSCLISCLIWWFCCLFIDMLDVTYLKYHLWKAYFRKIDIKIT